jgi:hypothetical protein
MINDRLQAVCKTVNCDYAFAQEVSQKITPLMIGAKNNLGSKFLEFFSQQINLSEQRMANYLNVISLIKKIDTNNLSEEEIMGFRLHFEFITIEEGLFSEDINVIAYFLVLNGHRFVINRLGEEATTLHEIAKINLSRKLDFLGKNGFEELQIRKNDVVRLRNAVAHLFYRIHKDGSVSCKEIKFSKGKYLELCEFLRQLTLSMYVVQAIVLASDQFSE